MRIRLTIMTIWLWMCVMLRSVRSFAIAVVLMVSIVSSILIPPAAAATAGPNSPTSGVDNSGTGTVAWTNPANVVTSNATYATQSLGSAVVGHYVFATNYGFSVPTTATITGITVEVQEFAGTAAAAKITDNSVLLVKASAVTGTSQATTTTWPTSNAYVSYGGTSTLWGATLTPADVNATTFGAAVSAKNVKVSGGGATLSASIDHIRITVTYSLPTAYNQGSYRLFNNQDASGTASLNFASKVDYATAGGPTGVVTADFNGDGKLDMATANFNVNSVSILIGSGTGTFATKVDYTTGVNPDYLVAKDFNGDGFVDIAVTNNGASTVSVLINSGTGTFATKVDYGTGLSPIGIATADFNGDGKADLAISNNNPSTVSVLINSGTGTFATKVDYGTGIGNRAVVAADFNGDGKIDLATQNSNDNTVSVFIGSGTGTFATRVNYPTGASSIDIGAADFNGDGKIDLATANTAAPGLSILINSGTGTFATNVDYTTGNPLEDIVVADYNGDGKLDIASVSSSSSNVYVIVNNGTGTFGAGVSYAMTTFGYGITTGDYNSDGKPDVVATNTNGTTVSVLINNSTIPVDVGSALAAQSTAGTVPVGQPFRLRVDIGVSTTDLVSNGQAFKLQYAPMMTSCDTAFVNTSSYSDVTAASTVGYYNNTVAVSGATMVTNANDPTDGTNTPYTAAGLIRQTYQESGTTTFTNANSVTAGQDGMWDFALTTNAAPSATSYCLRIVKSTGSNLDTYTTIPQITTASSNTAPNSPTATAQKTTTDVVIPTGNWTNTTSVKFTASATDPDASDTLALCVEKKAIGSAFVNTEDLCGTAVAYSGTAVTPTVTITSIPDAAQYHWQARLKDTAGAYSAWVAYGGNAETVADFGIDTTAPTGGTVYDGTSAGVDTNFNNASLTTLSANWSGMSTAAAGLAGYEYSIGTTPGGITVKGWTSTGTTASMTDSSLSLQTSLKYYVNVRTTDNAGNVSAVLSSDGQIVAPSVSFSVSPATITFNNLKASNAYTDTQTTTLTTSTNAYGGYSVRAYTTDLLRAANNQTIGMFNGGTYASPGAWLGSNTGFGYTSNDTLVQGVNKFSPATCAGGGSPPCYAPFTLATPGDIVADHASGVLGTAIVSEPFILTYRVTASATQAATKYNTVTVYSITPIY